MQIILTLVLILSAPAASLSAARSAAARPAPPPIDLRQYFKDGFASAAESLSPTSIVQMLPSYGDNSSSNAAKTTRRPAPLRQEMFSSPLISVLYDRVLPPLWASGLRIGGPEEEYRNAVAYLLRGEEGGEEADSGDARDHGVALDLSCGTGLVGVRMARSGRFRHVFALDYSAQMLAEAVATVKRENRSTPGGSTVEDLPLSIIRGDAGQLPFEDEYIDSVHWGAAMHCVPDAERAMAEVNRVLKPGGRVYATTFLRPFPDVVFRFFDLHELVGIARGSGFDGAGDGGELEVEALRRVYGVIRATKGRP